MNIIARILGAKPANDPYRIEASLAERKAIRLSGGYVAKKGRG